MNLVHTTLRSIRRGLSLAQMVLLLSAVVVGGVHHHASETSAHPCAICSLSHMPATPAVAAVGSVIVIRMDRVVAEPLATPRPSRLPSIASRAPPLS